MTHDQTRETLSIGQRDSELNERLSQGLDEVNFPATGTTAADQSSLSVKVVDEAGELLGGLSGWTWAGLLGIEMLWIREKSRKDGWGSKILLAAEAEARRMRLRPRLRVVLHLPGTGVLPAPRICRDRPDPGNPGRRRGCPHVQEAGTGLEEE